MALYARQISPSEQTSPFWDSTEIWDGILLYKPVRKYAIDSHYKSVLEVLQNLNISPQCIPQHFFVYSGKRRGSRTADAY